MTTPVPDPGPPERRGRGRNGHQQADPSWYAGPLYDDTGWHLDLSEQQDTDDRPDRVRQGEPDPRPDGGRFPEPGASGDSSFRYERTYDRNGAYPPQPGHDRPASSQGQVGDRPGGRHARHARSDDGPAGPWRDMPAQEPYQRGWNDAAGPPPGGDPYQDYRGYREPGEAGHRGYPPPGDSSYPRQPGHRGYPEPQPFTGQPSYPDSEFRDSASQPESQRSYPAAPDAHPPSGYFEPRSPDGSPPYQDPRPHPDNPLYQDPRSRHESPGPLDPRPHPDNPAYQDPRPDYGRLGSRSAPPDPEYWSMSDPAVQQGSRPDLPAPPPGWERPGEPAFMKYPDPPIYPEPPGQPYTEHTMILPVMWSAQTQAADAATEDATQRAAGSPSIVRSSGVMAIGTLASRLTGFVRTLIQVYALGTVALSTVYNNANTLPNVVYNLALGGILTSVIVPLIVNAAKRGSDGGEAYDQRMFSLITAALLGITLVATLAAAPLVDLYKGDISGSNLHLLVIFAYFFIPQIFFYGMSSLIGAVLNSRGSFAAPMWTPVVNNVVVIAVLVMFMMTARPALASSSFPHVSGGEVLLLGVGTTLGIAAQTAALVPSLRRVGFRWRPRWDFRRGEASEIGRMGGWMFCYIAATQVAFLVTTNICNVAQPGTGYTAYTYAWQLFQLPYAVVGISVITALLPRMSAHASEGRLRLVREDFSVGVRLASVIVVPCSLILAALGPGLALVFLDHGGAASAGGAARADYIGVVFAVFCLGLLPYMLFQLQLRVFYSLHDSKTPALIGLGTMSLNIAANVIALNVLPPRDVVAGLGVGFGLANLLGAFLAWRILSRRLHGLDGPTIGGTLVRMYAAAIPAALFAITIGLLVTDIVAGGRTGAAITIVVGGGGALLLYVLFARALRVSELTSLGRSLMARLGR